MKINYGNTVPISTVDWHGKVSIVFFLRGCPYRCPYCQNHALLFEKNMVDVSVLEEEIKSSRPFVSSVVLSGGEPLMQKGAVVHLAGFAKKNGMLVGIHTCGHYPGVIEELIDADLVDKFFIDVKAPLDNSRMYSKAIGCQDFSDVHVDPKISMEKVSRSISIVLGSRVELELRTTLIRDLIGSDDDVRLIARSIYDLTGRRDIPYALQQGSTADAMLGSLREIRPLSRDELVDLASVACEFLDNVYVRTREKGNEKINFESI